MPGGIIKLPFPPSSLSGHSDKHFWRMRPIIKKHRDLAYAEALNAAIPVPDEGDIEIRVEFYPPNKRGDRINFPNRMKPYFDGIADALRVNDSRFLPTYVFGEPGAGCVVVTIS